MSFPTVNCTHDIPSPFCWDPTFQVFYDNLDGEHKQLFEGVFKLEKDRSSAQKLKNLQEVVKAHFADEEGMMSKANFPEYGKHKHAHDEFYGKLMSLSSAQVDDEAIKYATRWLVSHIKDTDMKYKKQL
uniref:Hemerythrin n=1 Tax=Mesochaetopterus taylori TaxID=352254 RepID=A0A1S6QCN6_9ANNE|nr:hemerythrin [Mesochaetopterus taylori]